MTPSTLLFFSSMTVGTMVSASSSNWLYLWMGMELNLLSFVPIMAHSHKLQETMGSIKYFMIQAVGSGLMLTAGISSVNPITASNQYTISSMFIMSMCLKLGAAPYHQWLPHVMTSLPWMTCLILATWQKISPLVMLMFITPSNMMFMILMLAALSALVGGAGGLNQSQMRGLMAYSSVGHMGWMLATLTLSNKLSLIYFSAYVLITSSLMLVFMKTNSMMSSMSNSVMPAKIIMFSMVVLMLLSLGGLPPFMGFIPKWLVIYTLSEENMITVLLMLIMGSMMNLFYYFAMMFNFMLTPQQSLMTYAPPMWPTMLTMSVTIMPAMIML
uniref:NADH-ubiquinone oxidoreductase chain 2 n=1 Tax=Nereis zonata TaxID=880888 RepID=A0A7M3UIY5_9ANNE|nr:NADH dehydrogenase subunit 2 [Nereis zonata]QOH99550.1 NADH dehydrogenase subunit 2 [Nereis zonata]